MVASTLFSIGPRRMGLRTGDNPARWRGHLDSLLPARANVRAVTHHPALPYAAIGAFMTSLREQDSVAARALEFAILTTARTGEVLGAKLEEIDVKAKLWTVPAARMKSKREDRVPLFKRAIEILRRPVPGLMRIRISNRDSYSPAGARPSR